MKILLLVLALMMSALTGCATHTLPDRAKVLPTEVTAETREKKTVPWKSFIQGLRFAQVEVGKWDFFYEERMFNMSTLVEVPAGFMTIRDVVRFGEKGGETEYLVVTNSDLKLKLHDQKGPKVQPANVRLIYSCVGMGDKACMEHLIKLLKTKVVMESLEVAASSNDYIRSGILPDSQLFIGFFLNTAGKFAR